MAQHRTHPHIDVDGICGEAGTLHGHIHGADKDSLTFQCGAVQPAPGTMESTRCGHIFDVSWDEIDAINEPLLENEPTECLHLPPCPACGGFTVFTFSDTEYGSDVPEHHTMKALRQHGLKRPRLKKLKPFEASRITGKHHGFDFSHLPVKDRPGHHRKVDIAAELAELRRSHDAPEQKPPKQHPALEGAVVPGELRSAE